MINERKEYNRINSLNGKQRVVISGITPDIDHGKYCIKRCIGEEIKIKAVIFSDGHDDITCCVTYKHHEDAHVTTIAMNPLGNNIWQTAFIVDKIGYYYYSIKAWTDQNAITSSLTFKAIVEPPDAGFSAWYEIFPRSLSTKPGKHGTLHDLIDFLPEIKRMGFGIVYLPPIHPIGHTSRKGKNNSTTSQLNDCGCPWSIGNKQGGHMAIHPELGTLREFKLLLSEANKINLKIAMDYTLQCSPDHSYVKFHPTWFKRNSDGTIKFAENPPKKYEDVLPFNFESNDWQQLWHECYKIIHFWIEKGIKIFRVDNPHTKPFIFWEWLINKIKNKFPDVIFLSEAFTQPHVMYHLAKIGFSQSYTYFTWRNTKNEIIQYMNELLSQPVSEYYRPNFWPNTPDILSYYLQKGGRAAFIARLILAATLSTNYGIYGPAFERCINAPLHDGSEEYLDSEKYELKNWRLNSSNNDISDIIIAVNAIRNKHHALKNMHSLQFHNIDNDHLICYSKLDDQSSDNILVVVNLDYCHKQSGFIDLPLGRFNLKNHSYHAHDLLTGNRYKWEGNRNYVQLDPLLPAHIMHLSNII